jgi:hypothetical protein
MITLNINYMNTHYYDLKETELLVIFISSTSYSASNSYRSTVLNTSA